MAYSANLIPTMTSATDPSGVASASAEYAGNEAWRAFDHSLAASNGWACTTTSGQLCYQFPTAKTISRYAVTACNHASPRGPRSWIFEGSNDGTNWTTLDTRTHGLWGASERLQYDITNSTAYLYCRLNGNNTGTSPVEGELLVGELEMMETEGGGGGTVPLMADHYSRMRRG